MSKLDPIVRGDTFRYSFTLSDDWTGASFTGGVKFTLRTTAPASSVVSDAGVVHQALSTGGSPEITFSGNVGTILIPASATTTWGARSYLWDLQGVVSGTTPTVYTIDSGTISVTPDITRST